jgi:hypothetical protein
MGERHKMPIGMAVFINPVSGDLWPMIEQF